jgi:uncharacterized protein
VTHPHANLVWQGFEAYGRGDLEALEQHYFAREIKYHLPGRCHLAGDYQGVDEMMRVLRQFIELSNKTIRLEVHDVLADEKHAVALFTVRAERLGRKLENKNVHVFHIHGGKATDVWAFPGDLYAWDEFWS